MANYFLKIANSGKFIYSKIKITDKALHSPNLLLRVFLGISGGGVVGWGKGIGVLRMTFRLVYISWLHLVTAYPEV